MAEDDIDEGEAVDEDAPEEEAPEEEADESEEEEAPGEVDVLAGEMGWAPEDKWRGNPEDWVDSKTFMRRGPEILKETLRRQDATPEQVRADLSVLRTRDETRDARALERARTTLLAHQREAVELGDTDTFDQTTAQIAELDKESAPAPAADPDSDPAYMAWAKDNAWYGDDVEATAYAESIAPVVSRTSQGAEFYTKIGEEVRKKFPKKFSNAKRGEAPRVEGSGGRAKPRRSGGKGYEDLPSDARKECDAYVRQKLGKREDYCKDYFEEEAA